jgi:hypothetical protein
MSFIYCSVVLIGALILYIKVSNKRKTRREIEMVRRVYMANIKSPYKLKLDESFY